MKTRKQFRRIVVAAACGLAGLTLAASSVMAQYQVGQVGRALDANNRVGGGGLNQSVYVPPNPYGNYNNNLITGNVTGGKQFTGFVPYSSPDAFRGPTAGTISDQFIRQSSGAPYGGAPQNNAQANQSFFGVSQAAPPPPGYVQQNPVGNTGYTPSQFKAVSASDSRMDSYMMGSQPAAALPQPGQLLLPGPVDPTTQNPTVITASPLYGWRQWNPNSASDQASLDNTMGGSNSALNKIDPSTLEQMRNELTQPAPQTDDQQQLMQQQNQDLKSGKLDSAVPTPFDAPMNQPISGASAFKSNQPLNSSALAANNTLQTGSSMRVRLMTPQQQSTQYAELQKRLKQNEMAQAIAQSDDQTDAARQLQAQNKANTNPNAPTTPGGTPGNPMAAGGVNPPGGLRGSSLPLPTTPNPPLPVGPGPIPPAMSGQQAQAPLPNAAPLPPVGGAVPRPAPLPIPSLADGVKAKGLADLLKEAETQMKAGKYSSALEAYDLAEELAPNNPLIPLGRANAELGQSYYSRAEQHLRQAFTQDQALLMGRFDLRAWLGTERLDALVQDLKGIANRDQKEARPVFLLAYIYYSIGDERMASAYLDLADKRSGGKDELYPLIRKHWELPAPAPVDQNK